MQAARRLFSTTQPRRVALKHLPYEMGALEPIMSAMTLDFHYGKHHRTYVTNLNNLLEKQAECVARNDNAGQIKLLNAIRFNGGGHENHTLFWESLCPQADSELPTSGDLFDKIVETWGTLDNFIKVFNTKTAALQGSGWGWLCYNTTTGILSFKTTLNQDMLMDIYPEHRPLFGVDIWEHAYYLDYRNSRPQYLNNIWKITNWQVVEQRLQAALVESGAKQP